MFGRSKSPLKSINNFQVESILPSKSTASTI
uniref:Uncharacterized protein n=1 Tax=Rhizophora mucronata TaxID=61149 RepID=A0A2P2Q2M6_RHIMU